MAPKLIKHKLKNLPPRRMLYVVTHKLDSGQGLAAAEALFTGQ